MAKKRPRPRKKVSKSRRQPGASSELPFVIPDRRAIEGIMRDFVGQMSGASAAKTPLDQAQALIYQAVDNPDPAERIKLAKRALDLSADCADAYVLLAENTPSRKAALDYYAKAV